MKQAAVYFLILSIILCSPSLLHAKKQYQEIPLPEVPLNVISAAHEKLFDMKFVEAELITEEGGLEYYEFEGIKDEAKYIIHVDINGKVLKFGLEEEFEEEILERRLSELPEKVRTAAENIKGGLILTGFRTERVGHGNVMYEVEGNKDDVCYEAEIDINGNVFEIEECD